MGHWTDNIDRLLHGVGQNRYGGRIACSCLRGSRLRSIKKPPSEKAFIAAKAFDFQPSLVIYKPQNIESYVFQKWREIMDCLNHSTFQVFLRNIK